MKAPDCTQDHRIWQIDEVVADVFQMMLQQRCEVLEDAAASGIDISAMVLLSGPIEAQCLVEFPHPTAKKLANALLGCEGIWEDAMIEDAVGELCNMIAGGWKSKLGTAASASGLSVPAISRSRAPDRIPLNGGSLGMRRTYAFDNSPFTVSLAIRGPLGNWSPPHSTK
jgi:chemotaxis protein CheX